MPLIELHAIMEHSPRPALTPLAKQRTYSPTTDSKENSEEIYTEVLDSNNRSRVVRKNHRVEKIFNRNYDRDGTSYHFSNEIRILTLLEAKGHDISPHLHYTETFKDTRVINMDYCGIDLCTIYELCNANHKYIEPLSRRVYHFTPEWWIFNVRNFCNQIKVIATILQDENILHLDFKAENFVFNLETLKVRVIDFANSVVTTDKYDEEKLKNHSIGTTMYMSPEAVLEGDRSQATDVWALATTLYVLYTGEYLPYSTYEFANMTFSVGGTVVNPQKYKPYYDAMLKKAGAYITKKFSYNPEIVSLAKYFVKKEERPTSFE